MVWASIILNGVWTTKMADEYRLDYFVSKSIIYSFLIVDNLVQIKYLNSCLLIALFHFSV